MLKIIFLLLAGCISRLHVSSFLLIPRGIDNFQTASSSTLRHRHAVAPRLSAAASSSQQSSSSSVDTTPTSTTLQHECTFCSDRFTSRNALFRHIRTIHDTDKILPTRQSVVFHFGYYNISSDQAGSLLTESFTNALSLCSSNNHTYELLGTTQTSMARARTAALAQDSDCPSALDMLVVNILTPPIAWSHELVQTMIQDLKGTGVTIHGYRPQQDGDRSIHAEQSCSQHVYHYLLPLSWLPDGDNIAPTLGHSSFATSPYLKKLKRILRSVESTRFVPPKDEASSASDSTTTKDNSPILSSPRFGLLRHRAKRPWHNFANPDLCGQASPNSQVVWRIIDRARILGWIHDSNDSANDSTRGAGQTQTLLSSASPAASKSSPSSKQQVYLIVEFRGDQFLQQQVRRIVATAVAMTHDWLPDDFLTNATDRQVVLETPLAPAGYLYRAGSRHHAVEMYKLGRPLFEWDDVVKVGDSFNDNAAATTTTMTTTTDPVTWMQRQLLNDINTNESDAWLRELRGETAPRICRELRAQDVNVCTKSSVEYKPAPEVYQPVLEMLQKLVETKQWPATSSARANVILGDLDTTETPAGSFTVVSKEQVEGYYSLPLGNSLFPELAAAVFDLEKSLSIDSCRPPSSHCAINCNAQFTPHVDSGRGSGQSLSMIVALGDFAGGELMVEGKSHDIRYEPLEFDGWKKRHWTRSFSGQRFSLVWFTPEGSAVPR